METSDQAPSGKQISHIKQRGQSLLTVGSVKIITLIVKGYFYLAMCVQLLLQNYFFVDIVALHSAHHNRKGASHMARIKEAFGDQRKYQAKCKNMTK